MCRATVDSLVFVLQMSKRIKEIDWSKIAGASPKPKRLHLEEDESDGFFHCPVQTCDHDFQLKGVAENMLRTSTLGFITLIQSLMTV